jgi:hypothetical protein
MLHIAITKKTTFLYMPFTLILNNIAKHIHLSKEEQVVFTDLLKPRRASCFYQHATIANR